MQGLLILSGVIKPQTDVIVVFGIFFEVPFGVWYCEFVTVLGGTSGVDAG